MNQIAATIGITQMSHIADIVASHQSNGLFYDDALRNVPGITVLKRLPDTQSAYWVYTFLADRRDDLLRFLRSKGVYASKVHCRNDRYNCFEKIHQELPGVDEFEQRSLSIPCGWWVAEEDRHYIVSTLGEGW
jgi:dTDP-4-amino-4,6-dideoxygalactose transaminase